MNKLNGKFYETEIKETIHKNDINAIDTNDRYYEIGDPSKNNITILKKTNNNKINENNNNIYDNINKEKFILKRNWLIKFSKWI